MVIIIFYKKKGESKQKGREEGADNR